jgi:RNA polymerase primary sigma factor
MKPEFSQHLGLVHWVASRYRHAAGSLSFDELVSAGNLGLLRALELYEPERGVSFTTYARHWIRHFVVRELQNHGATVRVPVHTQALRRQRKERIRELVFSLDAPLPNGRSGEGRETWHDVMPAPASGELGAAHDVAQLLGRCNLTPGERRLLALRFWGDETLNDAGRELGVSRERARQLQEAALEKLRGAAA